MTTALKLTEAQARILKAMREGAELWDYRYMKGGPFLGKGKASAVVLQKLMACKFLHCARLTTTTHEYGLTPAGAAALAVWEAEQEGKVGT